MEATSNTPFKLPLWSEWAVKVKGKSRQCYKCNNSIPLLKELAIQSLFKYLRLTNKCLDLPKILQDNFIPPVLYIDVACLLFAAKQWSALRSIVSYWPFEKFQLSQIIPITCSQCWLTFLESDDLEDPEKEGGDTERQLFRKVFKHVLDGFFYVVKRTLENEGQKSPLRGLDLTLETSQDIRSFLWEDEFRRLGRRMTKTLDVCILAGMHKKMRLCKHQQTMRQNKNLSTSRRSPNSWTTKTDDDDVIIDYWQPPPEQMNFDAVTSESTTFEISTWGEEMIPTTITLPDVDSAVDTNNQCNQVWQDENKSPEIGVWNGNALDFSHLTEMPLFNITIDASISEKSNDILSWVQQRYDEFAPSPSPIFVTVRFLEVNLHEERKLEDLMDRLPEHMVGLKMIEICERRSAMTLASNISRFISVRCLDLGSCAFDLADHPQAVEMLAYALGQLPRLERLSLAHNRLEGCLATLLTPLQQGLELLDLSSCCLNDDDLVYLGESFHRTTFRSLSLAANELGFHWEQLLPLVDKLGYGTNLRILDLSSNDFVESQLTVLSRTTLGPLSSLALLDLSWHELNLTSLVSIIELLASKTNLRTFCLSTPIDMIESGYDQPDSWQLFVNFTEALTAKYRGDQARPSLTLHWCLM